MKKYLSSIIILFLFTACGPHLYNSMSGGKDNSSFIVVVTNGQAYKKVSLVVDGETYPIDKVYKLKMIRKAHPLIVSPGKHAIEVIADNQTLIQENVFIGLQETKKIVLQ